MPKLPEPVIRELIIALAPPPIESREPLWVRAFLDPEEGWLHGFEPVPVVRLSFLLQICLDSSCEARQICRLIYSRLPSPFQLHAREMAAAYGLPLLDIVNTRAG